MINQKKLILSSTMVIALAGTTGTVLAENSNFLNGKPFKALNDSIQANTSAITDNTTAIEAMALEVDTLFAQIAALDVRVSTNDTSIAEALTATSLVNGTIGALATTLFNLQASVSQDIYKIRAELVTIKGGITTLTGNLAALSAEVTMQVDLLTTAIANNATDVGLYTAKLTILNANMSTVQTAITLLQGQAAQTEIALADQQRSIDNLSATLNTLDVRVTALELLPPDSDVREFTVTDTGHADDITNADFKALLTTLSFQADDYLYIYGTGVSGVTEICTNDIRAKQAIDGFIGGYSAGGDGYSYIADTWLKRSLSWTFFGNQNNQITSHYSTTYQYLSFSLSIGYHWGQIYVAPESSGSSSEVYVSGWGNGQRQSATYRASSSRLDACGF